MADEGRSMASGASPQPTSGMRSRPRRLSCLQLYYGLSSCCRSCMRPGAAPADATVDGYCPPESSIKHPGAAMAHSLLGIAGH